MAVRRFRIALAVLALPLVLGACSGGSLNSFDPTDLLDFLDTKKKLPGDRRPLFPEGVPGIEPGVPRDMIKGNRPPEEAAPATAAAPAEPEPTPEKPKRAAKPRSASSAAASSARRQSPRPQPSAPTPAAEPDGDEEPASGGAVPTAPASGFPAPLPSGTFQR